MSASGRWVSRIGAAGAGGMPVLVFPEPGLWWLAYVVLVPALLLLRAAPTAGEAALRGWLVGAGFMLAVHAWLVPVTGPFMAAIAGVVGLLWMPWGVLAHQALRGLLTAGRVLVALLVLPAGWVVIEVVRSWEYLGGPWGLLGASQWQVSLALDLAAVGGVWLVSAAVVTVNTAVVAAGLSARARPARAVAVAAVVALGGGALAWSAVRPVPEPEGVLRVGVVQPGTVDDADERFAAGERITRDLTGAGVDLVAWGESSVALDLSSRPDLQARLARLADGAGAPVLVNVDARRAGERGVLKSAVLVGPDGVRDRYDKMRLVPFGEYVPLRPLLGWITSVSDAAAQDRIRGNGLVVMDAGPARVGTLVCFESAFPDMTRRLVVAGADVIVVQSSTWTFQDSWAPQQHASLAALRAAESGRPVVHATLTGQSAAFDGRGLPLGVPLGTGETGFMVYDVPLVQTTTPYAVLGDWVPALAAAALLGWLVALVRLGTPGARRRGEAFDDLVR